MAGRDEDKENAEADFFGDDMDWLDDDSEVIERRDAPFVPPSTTGLKGARSVLPKDQRVAERDKAIRPDPAILSGADTLVFSAVPTLTSAPFDLGDLDTVEVSREPAFEDQPTAEVSKAAIRPALGFDDQMAGGALTAVPDADVVYDDESAVFEIQPRPEPERDFFDDGDEDDEAIEAFVTDDVPEEPMVRTQDPAPARLSAPTRPSRPTLSPLANRVPRVSMAEDTEDWTRLLQTLRAEASVAGPDERGDLLYRSGLVATHGLAEFEPAWTDLQDALRANNQESWLFYSVVDVGVSLDMTAAVSEVLQERAGLADGQVAAEALQDAAAWSQSAGKLHEASALLQDSLAADSSLYSTLETLCHAPPPGFDSVEGWTLVAMGRPAGNQASAWSAVGDAASGAVAIDAWRRVHSDFANDRAVAELERLLDGEALAVFYEAQAAQDADSAGWWWGCAGRTWVDLGAHERADEAYRQARTAGFEFLGDEQTARLLAAGASSALAQTLEGSLSHLTGHERALVAFRLGALYEKDKDFERAAVAYEEASQAAQHSVIQDARIRVLRRAKRDEEIGPVLPKGEDADALHHLIRAEAAERCGDWEAARDAYAEIIDHAGWEVLALGGAVRASARMKDEASYRAFQKLRAKRVEVPGQRVTLLSAAVFGHEAAETDYLDLIEILDTQTDHLAALDALESVCTTGEQWATHARFLDIASSQVAQSDLRVALLYRAARVHDGRSGRPEQGVKNLRTSLQIRPAFEPARRALEYLQVQRDDFEPLCNRYRASVDEAEGAESKAWFAYAAAMLSGEQDDLRTAEAAMPNWPLFGRLLSEAAAARGDRTATRQADRRFIDGGASTEASRRALRLADLLWSQGEKDTAVQVLDQFAGMNVPNRPVQAGLHMARRFGAKGTALRILADEVAEWVPRERLLLREHLDAKVLAQELGRIIASGKATPTELECAVRMGAPSVRAAAHLALSTIEGAPEPYREAHALWAAQHFEQLERYADARDAWQRVAGLSPGSERARVGILRSSLHLKDVEALSACAQTTGYDSIGISIALAEIDLSAAVEIVETAVAAEPRVASLLILETLYSKAERWEGVVDLLNRLDDRICDENLRASFNQRLRWVLAEKLAHTDLAWQTFQALHDEQPEDRHTTETLARIAGAREETGLAIQYLDELAGLTDDPVESARYKRRVAEAQLAAGNRVAARDAYLQALDFVPDDTDTLSGIKSLTAEDEDWAVLVQVLRREASLVEGPARLECLAEIARVHQDKMKAPDIAIESWQAVLSESASNVEALDRLLVLTEAQQAWTTYVETAKTRSALAVGAERTALLRRMGEVHIDHLGDDDGRRYLEQAIAEDPPDAVAAARLEAYFRRKADWKGAARTLQVQARATSDRDEKVVVLRRAAELEVEMRHDRDAAAATFRMILELDPEHEDSLRYLANYLFETGRFDEAMPVCERLEPVVENGQDLDDFDTRMELAQFYFYYAEMLRLMEEPGALTRYDRALELNPTHLASLEAVGPLLCERKEWKRAETVYRQLLQLSGGQGERLKVATTYTQLGRVERALGRVDKATKRFNKALEIYPNHVDALKGIGLLTEDREDWSNLLTIYNNIIKHASVAEDVVIGYMTKGRVLDEKMNRPDKAQQHYLRSIDFKADQPAALLRLAELAVRNQEWSEAETWVSKALRVDSDEADELRPMVLLCQAVARRGAGKESEAMELFDRARALEGGAQLPDVLDDSAHAHIRAHLPPTL